MKEEAMIHFNLIKIPKTETCEGRISSGNERHFSECTAAEIS
jgi:hypothetical protein